MPCVCPIKDQRRRQYVATISGTLSAIASGTAFLLLPYFDVICDLLLNRRMAIWGIYLSHIIKKQKKLIVIKAIPQYCIAHPYCA